jgi:hypothetical protein
VKDAKSAQSQRLGVEGTKPGARRMGWGVDRQPSYSVAVGDGHGEWRKANATDGKWKPEADADAGATGKDRSRKDEDPAPRTCMCGVFESTSTVRLLLAAERQPLVQPGRFARAVCATSSSTSSSGGEDGFSDRAFVWRTARCLHCTVRHAHCPHETFARDNLHATGVGGSAPCGAGLHGVKRRSVGTGHHRLEWQCDVHSLTGRAMQCKRGTLSHRSVH